MLSWYEATLSSRERKVRGHFSTPALLIERILDACGYTPDRDLSHLRILDPACGSGNFLAAVAKRLMIYANRLGLSHGELANLVQKNIWGFDPDPVACFLSEMHVRGVLAEEEPLLPGNGHYEDARLHSLHIHQADGLTFPWRDSQNVDLFLANPPYLAAKNTDLSGYRSARQRGQADSYLLFLELALHVVRPGGWLAVVLPDPMLARANAAEERKCLLSQTTVHHLWHLAGVFNAYVGAVVIIAQKHPPSESHGIAWLRAQWREGQISASLTAVQTGTIAQSSLCSQPQAELRYLLSDTRYALIKRLHQHLQASSRADIDHASHFALLGTLATIHRGEELGKDHTLLNTMPQVEVADSYPVLRGGVDVRPYATPIAHCWIAGFSVIKPLQRYLVPKLLVVKSTGRLQAVLDLKGHVVLQTLYMLSLREEGELAQEDELYYLLALLNSSLLREYVHALHTAYKWVQPQLEQHVLAHLPIPTTTMSEKAHIIQRARLLTLACSETSTVVELSKMALYQEQERAIRHLYEAALQADIAELCELNG
jgi:SAM-dependent methyltransferase